jgi:large subunit ribosomal protein L25
VLYGGGKTAKSLSVVPKDFKKLAESDVSYRPGRLTLASKEIPCVIKDIQCNPKTGAPIHIDFLNLEEAKVFTMFLTIETMGISPGVKRGGILNLVVPRLEIVVDSSAVRNVPDCIKIDISSMHIGSVYHLEELELPKGIFPANKTRDGTILSVIAPSGQKEETVAS